jgi:hypothetical protein
VDRPPVDQVLIDGQKPKRKGPQRKLRPFFFGSTPSEPALKRVWIEQNHPHVVIARLVRATQFSSLGKWVARIKRAMTKVG